MVIPDNSCIGYVFKSVLCFTSVLQDRVIWFQNLCFQDGLAFALRCARRTFLDTFAVARIPWRTSATDNIEECALIAWDPQSRVSAEAVSVLRLFKQCPEEWLVKQAYLYHKPLGLFTNIDNQVSLWDVFWYRRGVFLECQADSFAAHLARVKPKGCEMGSF